MSRSSGPAPRDDGPQPQLVAIVPIPPTYGIHDTYVRDGLAFVFAWNAGVIIYDVGNGVRGGSPESPVEVSRLVTSDNGVAKSPAVHNGWAAYNSMRANGQEWQGSSEMAGIFSDFVRLGVMYGLNNGRPPEEIYIEMPTANRSEASYY